jgi:hypothetical protein
LLPGQGLRGIDISENGECRDYAGDDRDLFHWVPPAIAQRATHVSIPWVYVPGS